MLFDAPLIHGLTVREELIDEKEEAALLAKLDRIHLDTLTNYRACVVLGQVRSIRYCLFT